MVPRQAVRSHRRHSSYVVSLLIWLAVWLINAYFTVTMVQAFGFWLERMGESPLNVFLGGLFASLPVAIGLHVVSSLIEGGLWSDVSLETTLTALLALALDMGTTVRGLEQSLAALSLTVSTLTLWGIALVLALLPELMILRYLARMGAIGDSR